LVQSEHGQRSYKSTETFSLRDLGVEKELRKKDIGVTPPRKKKKKKSKRGGGGNSIARQGIGFPIQKNSNRTKCRAIQYDERADEGERHG